MTTSATTKRTRKPMSEETKAKIRASRLKGSAAKKAANLKLASSGPSAELVELKERRSRTLAENCTLLRQKFESLPWSHKTSPEELTIVKDLKETVDQFLGHFSKGR